MPAPLAASRPLRESSTTPIPDRALAAVLRIDLFPPPPAPAPPESSPNAPPPRLDVELVAILITSAATGVSEGVTVRRAFLYDPKTQTYATLGVGDALREP